MPVDCDNPTNSKGATASSPWTGIEAVKSDFNAWVDFIREVRGLLGLALDRLKTEVYPRLQAEDPEAAETVARLMVKMAGYQMKTIFVKEEKWPTITNLNAETLRLRDLAVEGCGLLAQAGIWARRFGSDVDYGDLETWEDARKKGPPDWRTVAGWGAAVFAAVALLGAAGYALTAVASARRAGGPRTNGGRARSYINNGSKGRKNGRKAA